MVTNLYFENYDSFPEQELLEELIIESIQQYGQDMYYLPRNINNLDKLYTEDDQSSYTKAILLETYIVSVDGFQGEGSFISKFGLEIRDQITLSFSRRRFQEEVANITLQPRPNEGDLIFFPLNNKCFKITFVDNYEMFYQLGSLQTWKVTCELFDYSNEIFNTGIARIDAIQRTNSTNILDYAVLDESGNYILDEDGNYLTSEKYNLETIKPTSVNNTLNEGSDNFPDGSDSFIDFSDVDPFSEGNI